VNADGVGLVVVDSEGKRQPGWTRRAGDYVERTEYDHGRRVLTASVGSPPTPFWHRVRRWIEGRRRDQRT
jgi:hypothetical protein